MIQPVALFHQKLLEAALEHYDLTQIPDAQQKRAILTKWKQTIESGKLKHAGEVALHGDFLSDIFGVVLGYARMTDDVAEWHLAQEQKTLLDATKADGALGFFTQANMDIRDSADIRAIIELKSASADLDAKQSKGYQKQTPVEQAFGYAPKHGKKCQWVLVSNYLELRLYHASSQVEYERFLLTDLTDDAQFLRFYFLLSCEHLLAKTGVSPIETLYRKSEDADERISKQFYADYTRARLHLFEHLKQQNGNLTPGPSPKEMGDSLPVGEGGGGVSDPEHELFLLEKTQKLLDRFIFICFCEDTGMLPDKTFRKLVQQAQESFLSIGAEFRIWPALQGLFRALDAGWPAQQIPKFNGELFKPDAGLDALVVDDEIFNELARITDYDFQSELNVNILGHIFEQSISDLEELRADILGERVDRKQGKRKKEGVFYTPEYITRYIVEQAVGGWLDDRKQELGFETLPDLTPEDLDSIRLVKSHYVGNKKVEQHRAFWEAYRETLANIAVLDPACGSGAFLNQAFRFLYNEGQRVNAALADLSNGQRSTFDVQKQILSRNLYGVDINHESVEITKLSLWLLTARKDTELTALDNNIKCGNSLIDNPLVAGAKAFKWEQEFPAIMQRGGFDVVIGNPPYATKIFTEIEKEYLRGNYETSEYQLDLYIAFIEKSVRNLKNNGYIGFITPNSWLKNLMFSQCRKFLLENTNFKVIIPNLANVFPDASVDTLIFISQKRCEYGSILIYEFYNNQLHYKHSLEQARLLHNDRYTFDVEVRDEIVSIFDKIKDNALNLEEICHITRGVNPYDKYRGQSDEIIRDKAYHASFKKDDTYVPEIRGKHVECYYHHWDGISYISYGDWLAAPRNPEFFEGERLIFRQVLGKRLICTYISERIILDQSIFIAKLKDEETKGRVSLKFLLPLFASKLYAFYFKFANNEFDQLFPKMKLGELKAFPIKLISPESQKIFIEKADTMLELNKQFHDGTQKFLRFIESSYQPKTLSNRLQAFHTLAFSDFVAELKKQKVTLTKQAEFDLLDLFESQKTQALALQEQIERTDREIDRMVYALYGLTEEKIQIVEGNS